MDALSFVASNLALFLAACALILLNAFFVAAEFAIVKVRRTRLEELVGMKVASARTALLCVDELDETLSATQLGITVSSLGLGWLGEPAFANLLVRLFPGAFMTGDGHHHVAAAGISFGLVTVLHVVLGELVPKSIAIFDAEKVTLLVAKPMRLFFLVSKPFIRVFTWLANRILWLLGYREAEEDPLSEHELKLVMKESKEDGVISENEAQIIVRAFEFSDKRVGDIMVPREKVDYISLARPLDQNLSVLKSKMRTRFPLCESGLDSVLGIVHIKDVWPILLTQFSNEAFQRCCRPPIFVAKTLRQDQLMRLFQSCRAHLAIVRDAEGKSIGIVTLEDVLEGLVGDIRDEHGN
jgi:CBS domain containing-hemolysin-like protein